VRRGSKEKEKQWCGRAPRGGGAIAVAAASTLASSTANFSTGADKRRLGAVGASCAVRLGKKRREEEKGAMVDARPLLKRVRQREPLGRGEGSGLGCRMEDGKGGGVFRSIDRVLDRQGRVTHG
jgi:hypothetical protein